MIDTIKIYLIKKHLFPFLGGTNSHETFVVTDGNTELEITFKLDFTNVFLESSFNSFRNIVATFKL